MANEIKLDWAISVAKTNGPNWSLRPSQQSITMTNKHVASGIVSIPTTAGGTAITVSNLTNVGVATFKNCDSTNFVQIGHYNGSTFYPVIRLNAGESFPVRLSQAVTLRALADTAAVDLEYRILDN